MVKGGEKLIYCYEAWYKGWGRKSWFLALRTYWMVPKKIPALIAYNITGEMHKKKGLNIGSKHIVSAEVFQWQALNNKKTNIIKSSKRSKERGGGRRGENNQ